MIRIIAHAGEAHSNEATSRIHELSWFVQLPLFLLVMVVFAAVVWLIVKKVDVTLLITSFALLVAGFSLFQVAPAVSAVAITIGLVATLGVTLLGLGAGK